MDMLLSVSHSLVIGQFYKEIFKLQIVCVCMCVCVCLCVYVCASTKLVYFIHQYTSWSTFHIEDTQ
jgi:hypothetical protein